MSGGIIATLILTGVGCLALIAYVAQSVENAKQERRRKVLALQERTRVCWNLVTELPSAYLPAELRQFLLAYLTGRHQDILSIDPGNNNSKSQLSNIKELQSQEYSSTLDTPEPVLTDLITAKNTAARIKDMVNFFVGIHKDGSLEKRTAQQYINQGKALYVVIKTDVSQLAARQVEATNNPKLALVHYNTCRTRLEPFANKGQMPLRIKFLDERIKKLKALANDQEKEEQTIKEEEQLKEEWNEFSKDSDWKIKHEYD
ncbi:MAG: hypothetical protein V7677_08750 [Motiliproteus sp.]